jgi:probable rRNA maturation factor
VNIQITDNQTDLLINFNQVERITEEVLKLEQEVCDEVSVCFVDTSTICTLHQDFFDDPSPTDCISFPLDEEPDLTYRLLGEIFVCPKTALDYAAEHQLNPYEETTLYIIHGLLHLIGYDDLDEEDSLLMRAAEQRHLINLKSKNLLLCSLN